MQRLAIQVIPSAAMAMTTAASSRVARERPSVGGLWLMAGYFALV